MWGSNRITEAKKLKRLHLSDMNICRQADGGGGDPKKKTTYRKFHQEGELLLRGTIVNRTYGTHKNLPGICLPIFYKSI